MKNLNNRKENKILARARAPPRNASIFSRAVFFTATTVSSPSVQTVEPWFLTQIWMDFRNSSSTRTSTKFRTSIISWQVARADGDRSIWSQRSTCEDDARSLLPENMRKEVRGTEVRQEDDCSNGGHSDGWDLSNSALRWITALQDNTLIIKMSN